MISPAARLLSVSCQVIQIFSFCHKARARQQSACLQPAGLPIMPDHCYPRYLNCLPSVPMYQEPHYLYMYSQIPCCLLLLLVRVHSNLRFQSFTSLQGTVRSCFLCRSNGKQRGKQHPNMSSLHCLYSFRGYRIPHRSSLRPVKQDL